ncbi:hypothetical protein [Cyanobium sp. Candia 9D4]|nr:hypothetical protein [Cyanobium sp. Candia 9D4]
MRESILEGLATPLEDLSDQPGLVSWSVHFSKQPQQRSGHSSLPDLCPGV